MLKFECLTKQTNPKSCKSLHSEYTYCNPDYGIDCNPDGECGPEDGSEDPYPF